VNRQVDASFLSCCYFPVTDHSLHHLLALAQLFTTSKSKAQQLAAYHQDGSSMRRHDKSVMQDFHILYFHNPS
jgi:hypothetical protein